MLSAIGSIPAFDALSMQAKCRKLSGEIVHGYAQSTKKTLLFKGLAVHYLHTAFVASRLRNALHSPGDARAASLAEFWGRKYTVIFGGCINYRR